MAALAAYALSLSLSSTPSTRVSAGADVEARAATATETSADERLELTPKFSALGRYGSWLLQGRYAPRLMIAPSSLKALHQLDASAQVRVNDASAVSVAQKLELGFNDFRYRMQVGDELPKLQRALEPLPPAVDAVTSGSDLSVWTQVAPRAQVNVGAGLYVAGGLSRGARELLPLQRGPYGSAGLRFLVDDRDTIGGRVEGAASFFDTGTTNQIYRSLAEWQRTLSPAWKGTMEAGGAYVLHNSERRAMPLLAATLEGEVPIRFRRLSVGTSAQVSPWTNPLTGLVTNRLRSLAYVRNEWDRHWAFELAGGVASAFNSSEGRALFGGSVVEYRLMPELSLRGGATWQRQRPIAEPAVRNVWTGFVALAFQPGERAGLHF